MPSGEALVRQFLYGQRYFESRFGKRCETAWLPDSFGLTAAYPQLIRDAGMKYFFTQKLSWYVNISAWFAVILQLAAGITCKCIFGVFISVY
jgi:alpha-mannosidase